MPPSSGKKTKTTGSARFCPEDQALNTHYHENLISHVMFSSFHILLLCSQHKYVPVNFPSFTVSQVLFKDRLCGLVVRVLGYRSGGPGSIPGTTRKKKKE
jgi:hypothetical protein